MADRSLQEQELSRGNFRSYNYRGTFFIKRELPPHERAKRHGQPISDPWLAKRFSDEVAAYQLLREKTTIPVPRVIAHGRDVYGLLFTEMELILSGVQASEAASVCRMPQSHDKTPGSGPCSACRSIVCQNVEEFCPEHGAAPAPQPQEQNHGPQRLRCTAALGHEPEQEQPNGVAREEVCGRMRPVMGSTALMSVPNKNAK